MWAVRLLFWNVYIILILGHIKSDKTNKDGKQKWYRQGKKGMAKVKTMY